MILIAGVGNIFHGDDAFGSEVARRLIEVSLPPAVRVVDFGIRGHDLAFALQDGYETAILVDTAQPALLVGIHLDARLASGQRCHHADHSAGAGHVPLHVLHPGGRLDADATRIERHALADKRDGAGLRGRTPGR